ncbi:acetyltransferase [Knoellia sinensis KCTC 19936]|uniref:Acetyltransferase n=1 Tax=Knoellia sinensis KCTC 19936 TaxID=1385520 RepID=A0A0A0JA56_9MICO|nr:GNAT family N-acetyltransferase [Knoellia sinensis]KGN32471.1 acetyltransferase [Knoellia sinensis KCTC 19936]
MSRGRGFVERLDSREALEVASAGDPVIRFDTGAGLLLPALVLTSTTAVAWAQTWPDGRRGVQFLGRVDELSDLLASPSFPEWFAGHAPAHVSAPRDAYSAVDAALPVRGGNTWDWMWTVTPPPATPAESRVQPIRVDEHDALVDFLRTHNPGTHAAPFARPGQEWVVIRDEAGRIIGCGCAEPGNAEVPLLGGITVDSAHQGQGLGGAITAYLTREAIARTGASSLGVFEDNPRARVLYERLGYRVGFAARTRFVVGSR